MEQSAGPGHARKILLVGILVSALAVRLYGIDWDQGYLFHPDERAILMKVGELSAGADWPPDVGLLLDPKASPLNPHWFPYGSFPLYLLKGIAHLLAYFQPSLSGADLRLVGRGLSAIFDVGSVALTYLLGAGLYGSGVGLGAAALVAFTVLHIQLSHFYAVDTLLTFFVLLALWGAMGTARKGSLVWGAVTGLALGLGLATKVSMAPMVITVLAAHALYILHPSEGSEDSGVRINRALRSLVLAGMVGGLALFLAQPYTIIDWDTFRADVVEQSEMVRRVRDYPYTRQYVDTAPYLYHIQQLATWGMGLPLGLLGWVGFLFTIFRGGTKRRPEDLLILSWAFPFFALTGAFPVKFMRYMLPLTPLLAIMGMEMLMAWRRQALRKADTSGLSLGYRNLPFWPLPSWLPAALFGGVLAASALYALAYLGIYSRPHPAVEAAAWVKAHVPQGRYLAREHWEESLPGLGDYREVMLNLYELDGPVKLDHIVQGLQRADYLVFYSNRLYGTIPRLPERYPLTSRYYRLLFSGELGFELEVFFSSYPTLGPKALVDDTFARPGLPVPGPLASYRPASLSINLGYADESFTVYDHPLVMIFKKKEALSEGSLRALLEAGLPQTGANRPVGLLFSEEEAARQRAGGTWSELFQRDSLSSRFPLLSWLVVVELLSLAALPIALGLFRVLPDRGYILAKGVGLLLPAYFSWLFASLRLIPFSGASVLMGAGLVALVSVYLLRYSPRRWEMWSYMRERWRLLAFEESLFLVAFFLFFWVRLLNPDLWHPWRGGEKPMDFAYLNAIIRSTYMPPYDPWFSGGYINYYYFGHFIVASLIKLTGILPSVAYNLAVPFLFALTASSAFSISYNLAGAAQGRRVSLSPMVAGLGGALAVVFLGNLDGMMQVVDGLGKIGEVRYESTIPGLSGLISALGGLWALAWEGRPMPPFDYWRSSRMLPPTISITEFPYFTFLFADLHAHLIALPFTLLAVGMALNLALGSGGLFRLGSLALVLGALRWINSWDFPTYFLLGWAALLIGEIGRRRRVDGALIGWVILKGAFLFALSLLLYWPLQRSYQLFYLGIQSSPERTPLHQYLQIHGLFLFILVSFLAYRLYEAAKGSPLSATKGWSLYRWVRLLVRYWWTLSHLLALRERLVRRENPLSMETLYYLAGAGLLALLLWLAGIPTGAFLLLLLAFVLILALMGFSLTPTLSREGRGGPDSPSYVERGLEGRPSDLFVLALVGLAAGIGLVVEVVTLQGDINRMNTVFKFYLQAWVLYALAAAYAFWWLLRKAGDSGIKLSPFWCRLWLGGLAVLVAGSLVYPLAATPVRVGDRFGFLPMTDDGMAYMKNVVYKEEKGDIELAWDYEAIRWLQDNVLGSPVILEGVTPLYRWGSRISVYTGLPTVIGWDWHETQQRLRYQYMVEERLRDVREIFTTTSPEAAMSLLEKYEVSYIIVGRLERLYYPKEGLDKFRGMAGAGYLSLVYQNPQMEIYTVSKR